MKSQSYTMHRLATDEKARRAVIDTASAAPNGEIVDVERRIAAYERTYGMSSDAAVDALRRGDLEPTCDVEGWMMAIAVRDHLMKLKAR